VSNPNFSYCDCGNELGAGSVIRFIKHVRPGMRTKVFGVSRREEGALVMVKPPGDFGRIGIFEVDDDVLIAVEETGFPGLGSAVGHAAEAKFGSRVKSFAIESDKKCRRSSAVKTAVVVTEPDAGHRFERVEPFVLYAPWAGVAKH